MIEKRIKIPEINSCAGDNHALVTGGKQIKKSGLSLKAFENPYIYIYMCVCVCVCVVVDFVSPAIAQTPLP